MTAYLQVQTTCPTREEAARLAQELVARRLAACTQVLGPITSTYWWQGKIETTEEWLCLLKTRADCYPAVENALVELHPYDIPEIIAVPVVAGNNRYLRWIQEKTTG